jgi:hypothetical protein
VGFLNKTFTLSYCERGPCSSFGSLFEIQCKDLYDSYLNSLNLAALPEEGKLYFSFSYFLGTLKIPLRIYILV